MLIGQGVLQRADSVHRAGIVHRAESVREGREDRECS